MKFVFLSLALLGGILFANCEGNQEDCDVNDASSSKIIISNSCYSDVSNDDFQFENVEIDGDSIRVTIRYGGGCGDIDVKLFDADVIMESFPIQRNIRIFFKDNDLCKALITTTVSFDLSPIQVSGNDKIILNLSDWGTSLLYEY